jgi:hypothetical protein
LSVNICGNQGFQKRINDPLAIVRICLREPSTSNNNLYFPSSESFFIARRIPNVSPCRTSSRCTGAWQQQQAVAAKHISDQCYTPLHSKKNSNNYLSPTASSPPSFTPCSQWSGQTMPGRAGPQGRFCWGRGRRWRAVEGPTGGCGRRAEAGTRLADDGASHDLGPCVLGQWRRRGARRRRVMRVRAWGTCRYGSVCLGRSSKQMRNFMWARQSLPCATTLGAWQRLSARQRTIYSNTYKFSRMLI